MALELGLYITTLSTNQLDTTSEVIRTKDKLPNANVIQVVFDPSQC